MVRIYKSYLASLGFDLADAVAQYTAAIEAHKFTVDVPRPIAHPVVEYVYERGGTFEVVDDTPADPPPPPDPDPLPEPPQMPPPGNTLTPAQFHAMVDILGKTDELRQSILTLPQPQRGRAYGKVYHSSLYRREHPLTETLRQRLNIPLAEFDAAWEEAKTLEP